MKFNSSIERVVGNIPPKEKEEVAAEMRNRFKTQYHLEATPDRPKSPEELQVLQLADKETDKALAAYGAKPFSIPPENIYLIDPKEWTLRQKTHGVFSPEAQAAALQSQRTLSALFTNTFHEMVHFKSYQAIQILKGKEDAGEIAPYRVGLTAHLRDSKDSEKWYFHALNEAITEEITKRATKPMLETHPLFTEDQKILQPARKGKRQLSDDMYALSVEDSGKPPNAQGKRTYLIVEQSYSYPKERAALKRLCQILSERATSEFPDEEAAFAAFARSSVTGNLLHLGRIIDRTFGKGMFRRLAEAKTGDALMEVVEQQ